MRPETLPGTNQAELDFGLWETELANETQPDFGIWETEFDIDVAFQEALHGVATDEELVVEDKIRRMETIVTEANSDTYRSFVDFRAMTAQIELFCNHDHLLGQAATSSELLSDFMSSNSTDHNHADHNHDTHGHDKEKAKKKKKVTGKGWLSWFIKD